jgi:hypothetical protein
MAGKNLLLPSSCEIKAQNARKKPKRQGVARYK